MKAKQTSNSENQLIVPCPNWFRNRILKNLRAAANSKLGPNRTKTASRILAAIG